MPDELKKGPIRCESVRLFMESFERDFEFHPKKMVAEFRENVLNCIEVTGRVSFEFLNHMKYVDAEIRRFQEDKTRPAEYKKFSNV